MKYSFRNAFLLLLLFCFPLLAQKDTIKTFYPNGNPESVIPLDNGAREGKAKFFFENGNLKEERTYLAGKVEGEVKRFYENGKTKELFSILKGKRDGATTTFDSLGNYLADVYYTEGKIQTGTEEPPDSDEVYTADNEADTTVSTASTPSFVAPTVEKIESKPEPVAQGEISDSALYRNPAIFPEPKIGYKKFYENVVYPKAAKDKKIEGTVLIKAIINEYGDVEKTEIIKGIGYGCEDAAEISISFAKFYPGLVLGRPVKVEMVFEIEFKLPKEK